MKRALARAGGTDPARGVSLLIYHRVGGGSADERDVSVASFTAQLDALRDHDVVSIDAAADRLESHDARPGFVLTFDDGFADVYDHAWPLLVQRAMPFTVYLATAYVGATMHWDGSTAVAPGPALTWSQLAEMCDSGLCTVGNHTDRHVRPSELTIAELDRCSERIGHHLGRTPSHFAYPWGIPVRAIEPSIRERFRTAVTGTLGRNVPGDDLMRLRRIPVRQTDPLEFFTAKLYGDLRAERIYAGLVGAAKRVGASA